MIMKQNVIILVIFLFLAACCQKKEKTLFSSMNQPLENPKELRKAVIEKGDTSAYYSLFMMYLDFQYPEEILFYSLIMADKYNYPDAYFDVFSCLTDVNRYYEKDNDDWSLDSLNNDLREMAVKYLIKAADKGHKQAKEVLEDYYLKGKYVKKDIVLGGD